MKLNSLLKKTFAPMLALLAAIAFCLVPGISANAAEISTQETTITSHQGKDNYAVAWDTYKLSDGTTVRFSYDKTTDVIDVYTNGMHKGSVTGQEVREEAEAVDPGVSSANPGLQSRRISGCSAAMAGLGVVNSIIWGVAGVTAPTPAGIAATIGGCVTGAVIGIGGAFC